MIRGRASNAPLPRVAVLLCVVGATIATIVNYPRALAELADRADTNAALGFADREIAGGNAVIPDQALLYAARATIPADAEFDVIIGEPTESWSELTAAHAGGFIRFFLMPRRLASGAEWVVCVNCDRDEVGGDAAWEGSEGLSVLRRTA